MSFDFVSLLQKLVQERPEQVALRNAQESITYAELDARSNAVAHGLAERGIGPGDRVAYLSNNRIEFFEFFFGAAKRRAIASPFNRRLTAPDIEFLIEDSGATLAFVDEDLENLLPDTISRVVYGPDYTAFRDSQPSTPVSVEPAPDDVVLMCYTSGTTGVPKGALIKNENYEYLLRVAEPLGMNERSVLLQAMPVHHVGGSGWPLYGLSVGGQVVIVETFDPARVADTIETHSVTHITLAPVMVAMMAAVQEERKRDFSSVEVVAYGGQPMTEKEFEKGLATFGNVLYNCYGMTECASVTYMPPREHEIGRLHSVGRPFDWVEIGIFDTVTTDPLPAGSTGELWVRHPGAIAGYWRREEQSGRLRNADGWLRTGDAGYIDSAGFLFLTDRLSDLIITGGENVYPAEVEGVLIKHPDIQDVAVVGLPHDKWGEAVSAFIVTENEKLDEQSVLEWARLRLAGFRRPQSIHIVDSLPRNASGKVLRRELRSQTPPERR
ncbi:class I adenylate-forming enzyme family protein [Nocardia miyunensis]|uniref:class I adenylate-forming enzyme family protein n=1 Tax=Nocardia miyunensis TaxID=282684 RepID=UPI0008318D38|nr:AMP-binding protein [Nocardia miyunensis]